MEIVKSSKGIYVIARLETHDPFVGVVLKPTMRERIREVGMEAPTRLIKISKRTNASRVTKVRSDSMAEKVVAAGKVGFVTARAIEDSQKSERDLCTSCGCEPVTPRRSPRLLASVSPTPQLKLLLHKLQAGSLSCL